MKYYRSTSTFIPDYVAVTAATEPLEHIMGCGEKHFEYEARKSIPGSSLLCMRKMKQEKNEFLNRTTKTKGKRRCQSKSIYAMWNDAFKKM